MNSVRLEDRYELSSGRVVLTGTQALVRLMLQQKAADAARGWRTAGYASGYRGSPIGGLDLQFEAAAAQLQAADVHFHPGVNEDLAATAVWGTQQVGLLPGARTDGVFALWYGKGPGVDRSGDPIKHGNRAGTAAKGGVLLVFGDDHAAKSSTVSHQSDTVLAAHGLPVLFPATVQELIDYGLHGFALSRYSGLWVGLKTVNETVEATATVEVGAGRVEPVLPPDDGMAAHIGIRVGFDPLGDDVRLHRYRLPRVHAYVRANRLDRLTHGRREAGGLGIVASGKAWLDVLDALDLLGLQSDERLLAVRLAIYKVALVSPLEPTGLRDFARGLAEVLVVEEKVAFVETQAAHILYDLPSAQRPALTGKRSPDGQPLLAADVPLEAFELAQALAGRLSALGLADAALHERMAVLQAQAAQLAQRQAVGQMRTPYFCAGCPHNTSTTVPEGSAAFGGIGCHVMAIFMDRRTLPPTQMGGEGANWIGMAPFTDMTHAFQNLGDGTYFHSGLLAVRAAVAAGVNLTYKLLYNDAVAMTGGQAVEGHLSVAEITQQLRAERIGRIAVVSDDPGRFGDRAGFASGTTLHHRRELALVQEELRAVKGVSVLLYDQVCAAEKRRRRKRGRMAAVERRVVINPLVCEGCGDCSVQSNCVAVEPLETEFGRKRRIDQSTCNADYSCLNGLCPSFVTVTGGRLRHRAGADLGPLGVLPAPPAANAAVRSILIAGIGGTGVVTVGALLVMAAHLEGREASAFDMTGLAQKGGAVYSHVRVGVVGRMPTAARVGAMEADLLFGCDLIVATSTESLRAIRRETTHVVLNEHLTPTAQFQRQRDVDFGAEVHRAQLESVAGAAAVAALDATQASRRLLGDSVGANTILLGYALQRGCLPVGVEALEAAIRLNGTAVELNLRALALGRLAAADPGRFASLLREEVAAEPARADAARRYQYLAEYQDRAYAERFQRQVDAIRDCERAIEPRSNALQRAVEEGYFRVLAIKDEYEVARLLTSAGFERQIAAQFEGPYRLHYQLAPPLFAARDPQTGRPRKRAYGQTLRPLLRWLAGMRRLRGRWYDPFRWTAERRLDHALLAEYEADLAEIVRGLSPARLPIAVELALLPWDVRGYGVVREHGANAVRARREQLRARWRATAP